MCVFQFSLTFCPHKTVTANRHVSVTQNILKMHLPLSMGSLLHKHLPKPLSGFCASKCTKNALTALEGDLTTCKPLPRPFSWIWEGREREMKGEMKGGEGKRKEGKGQGLALQTASLDPPLMDVQNEFTHKYTKKHGKSS